MKNFKKIILLASAALLTFTSCNNDDDNGYSADDQNTVTLKYENYLDGIGSIELGSTTATSASGQQYQFETLKYIVSDVVLVKTDGTEFSYHFNDPDNGAYIVDQSEAVSTHNFVMSNIPAGDYQSIRFGLGISPEAYVLGQEEQATFWDEAGEKSMTWSWASGYKFVNFEGTYGDNLDGHFKYHIANMGNPEVSQTPNVYKVISLDFPQTAKVRNDVSPEIHIMADVSQFLNGITLDASNETAMNPALETSQQAAENLSNMFMVDHIHND